MAESGWRAYLDISGIPEERQAEMTQALDSIWATESGQQIIREAFAANQNTKVTITGADTGYTHSNGAPISAATRQLDAPGRAEITFDFQPITFTHDGHQHPITTERLLRHELHHIAREQDDLAERLRPHLYAHIKEAGGLGEADIDKLREIGVLSQSEAETYKETISEGDYVGLATIESDGHRLTTAQFNQFTEHVLADETQAIRDLIGDVPITSRVVESLLRGGIETRIGAIRVDEAKELLQRLENGETVTVSDLEQAVGPLSYVELTQYVASTAAVATQLPEDKQQQLEQHLAKVDGMVVAWRDAQRAHEEATVDYTDSTMGGPDRGEYGNFQVEGDQSFQPHDSPVGNEDVKPLPGPGG